VRDEGRVLDRLARMVERLIDQNFADLDKAAVFNSEFRSLRPDRRKQVLAIRDAYEHFVRDLLSDGQRDGDVCADLDVRVASAGMLSMINSLYLWYRPRGKATKVTVKADLTAMAVNSVVCGPLCAHGSTAYRPARQAL
jgi:hypothetical protein